MNVVCSVLVSVVYQFLAPSKCLCSFTFSCLFLLLMIVSTEIFHTTCLSHRALRLWKRFSDLSFLFT